MPVFTLEVWTWLMRRSCSGFTSTTILMLQRHCRATCGGGDRGVSLPSPPVSPHGREAAMWGEVKQPNPEKGLLEGQSLRKVHGAQEVPWAEFGVREDPVFGCESPGVAAS